MKAAGITWLRTDFRWASIEPSLGNFLWANYDRFVANLQAKGVNLLAILDYGVGWANGGQTAAYPPNNPQDFADYCTAVVTRYAPRGVSAYEIWNEPNNGPYFTAQSYTALTKAAYTAIKAASASTTVLAGPSGGTNQLQFLQDMYAAGVGGYFDALTHHPYGNYWNNLPAIHQIMVAGGDGNKKIWLTEFGEPTFGAVGQSYVTEAQQAIEFTTALQNLASMDYAGPFFAYSYRDNQSLSDPQPDREGYFGILRNDNTKKLSYYAIRDTIQQLYS